MTLPQTNCWILLEVIADLKPLNFSDFENLHLDLELETFLALTHRLSLYFLSTFSLSFSSFFPFFL